MALPLRGTAKSCTATNGGDPTLTFDTGGGAPLEGDVVILFGGHGVTSATPAGPITAGYTAIHVDANAPDRGAWYKVMAPTPDLTVQGEGGGNGSDAVAYGAFVLDGSLIDPAIFDQTSVETTEGTRVPNAAPITTQTNGAWVIAIGFNSVVDTSRGVPSGYTTIIGASANDAADISIDAAYIEKATAGAEDPPAWSTWASGTAYEITLAIKPVGAITTPQAIPAVAVATPALALVVTYARTLGATAVGVATVSTALLTSVTMAATAVGVATLARVATYSRSLAATVVGVTVLTKGMFITLAATANVVAGLAKGMFKTMAATAAGVATLSTSLLSSVSIAATAMGSAVLSQARVFSQTVAASAVGVASLATQFIAGAGGAAKDLIHRIAIRLGIGL